jgi:2-phosphoglycerate kinase
MSDYLPLTDEEACSIAEKYYNKKAIHTTRQDAPTVILIAGQPGAGKTSAS